MNIAIEIDNTISSPFPALTLGLQKQCFFSPSKGESEKTNLIPKLTAHIA